MSFQLALPKTPALPASFLPNNKQLPQAFKIEQTFGVMSNVTRQRQAALSLDERLFDAKAGCKIKISEVSMYFPDEWRKGLYSQLDSLMDSENWEEDETPVTTVSFSTLLRMLALIKPTRRPGLASSSAGNIIAAWSSGESRLTIECLPGDSVRWVLSHIVDGIRESAAGVVQLTRVQAVLSPYNPDRWFDCAP